MITNKDINKSVFLRLEMEDGLFKWQNTKSRLQGLIPGYAFVTWNGSTHKISIDHVRILEPRK